MGNGQVVRHWVLVPGSGVRIPLPQPITAPKETVMHHHFFRYSQTFTVSDWLQLALVIATFLAVLVALFQDRLRDLLRRSRIKFFGKVSHMQGQDKLGFDYKLHYLRLMLQNSGYEARKVEVSV